LAGYNDYSYGMYMFIDMTTILILAIIYIIGVIYFSYLTTSHYFAGRWKEKLFILILAMLWPVFLSHGIWIRVKRLF